MTGQSSFDLSRGKLPAAFEAALCSLASSRLGGVDKGLGPTSLSLDEIGHQGWSVLGGDVPLPAMTLKWADLVHNIHLMQSYCDQHGAWLAPHGKATMMPQVWAEQIRAGAWAITVANVVQLQVCRAFGVHRALVANELVGDYDIRYAAQQLRADPDFDLYVLVDSLRGVERLCSGLRQADAGRPLQVMIEFGMADGRCGVRDISELQAVAAAVLQSRPLLQLVGVEGYEGIASGATDEERVARVHQYLDTLAQAARAVRSLVPEQEPFFVSAGGSAYFDLAIAHLGRHALPDAQLIVRPGAYVTHDSLHLERMSPMGSLSKRPLGVGLLRPALELWAVVLSRPEPELAILGLGLRDASADAGLPVPLFRSGIDGEVQELDEGYKVTRINDQHAYLRVPPEGDLAVGDRVGCGISHPCTALDKWRVVLVVDSIRQVTGAVRTYF